MPTIEDLLSDAQISASQDIHQTQLLAEELNVSVSSLKRLGLGWLSSLPESARDGLHCLQGRFIIPEREATGKLVGLATRARGLEKDNKGCVSGSKRGLTYAINPDYEDRPLNDLQEVGKAGIDCPICGKNDWCGVIGDPHSPDAAICMRESKGSIKETENDGWLHVFKQRKTPASPLPDTALPVVVVEGMSDTAAAMDLGFISVGRPSSSGGRKFLQELLRGRTVIVVGENDKKADGSWPGRTGAEATAKALREYGCNVTVILPPQPYKDLRAWKIHRSLTSEKFLDYAKAHAEPLPIESEIASSCGLNDVGNAERFARRHRKRIRWNDAGGWLAYDGNRWTSGSDVRASGLAVETAKALLNEARNASDANRGYVATHAARSQQRRSIDAMIALAKPLLAIDTNDLDTNPMLFNAQNGTVDLRTGLLRPHDPEDYITKIAATDFDPNAECPLWMKFLDRVFAGDSGLIDYMQRVIGYWLSGDISVQELWVLWGEGGNGKSVLLDTVMNLMGDYAMTAPDGLLVERRNQDHPTETASLIGTRLVVATETEDGARLRVNLIKRLTGDSTITTRRMRENFCVFKRTFKVSLVTNHMPRVAENNEAVWRRLRLIPFNVIIPKGERDTKLLDKLRAEWPGILSWAIKGCLSWQLNGLGTPPAVDQATNDYRSEQDVAGKFLADCCIQIEKPGVPVSKLYSTYQHWARIRGEYELPMRQFGRSIERLRYTKTSDRGNRTVWDKLDLSPGW